MSVKITNAVIQSGDVTITSAQFVVSDGLSYDDKLRTLSTLVEHAAVSLDLPHQGAIAAEILYRIADERAGVADLALPTPAPAKKRRDWKKWALGAAFWIGFVALLAAAVLLKGKAV